MITTILLSVLLGVVLGGLIVLYFIPNIIGYMFTGRDKNK